MYKVLVIVSLIGLAACAPAPPPVEAEPASPAYRDEALKRLGSIEEKVVGLADALPAETYTWRPGEGVRSVSEVLLHIAAANYGIPNYFGNSSARGLQFRRLRQTNHRQGRDRAEGQGVFSRTFGAPSKS